MIAGSQSTVAETISADTYVGDLYVYLSSPTQRVDVTITADAADVGEIIIPNTFVAGSTFEFVAINGGRFLGVGGAGGAGGNDLGAAGEAGNPGSNGGHAIDNNGTYAVSINVDDGYLFGGGGGGGGGSYTNDGTFGHPGGGGGGGQGYTGATGGLAGTPNGLPIAAAGTAGSRVAAGAGGVSTGATGGTSDGGDGGTWGLGGKTGRTSSLLNVGSGGLLYNGGLGGDAGRAYSGNVGTLTLSGSDSEATLRTNGRILGEIGTGGGYLSGPTLLFNALGWDIQPVTANVGIEFNSAGYLIEIDTTSSPGASTSYYITGGGGTGANYEVRVRNLSGDSQVAWDTSAAAAGTWVGCSVTRQWYNTDTNFGLGGSLFEMRRADIPGTTSTSDEVMLSFFVRAQLESEP